jgi:hypothetical protein
MEKTTADPTDLHAKALARWENEGGSARDLDTDPSVSRSPFADVEPPGRQPMMSVHVLRGDATR